MCGIAGMVAGESGAVINPQTVQRMCRSIVHRGPDDEGIYASGPAGIGMRRLSIIDLSTGHQPIHNEDQTVWVVFNGELYNFPLLRAELEKSGHRFYTNSDTEVLVHLYEQYGADFVARLRGMFGLALYDTKSHRLILARDRLGKKPLHYALVRGTLLFGSEIRCLLAAEPGLAEVRQESLLDYFYFGYIPDPHTAYQRIAKLPPAHLLDFQDGRVSLRRYWELPAYATQAPRSEEDLLEELQQRLEEAVRIRLLSDVPLGALLSGGVDSSTVVALMRKVSSGTVKTYSIRFSAEEFDESAHARAVAQHFATEHHELEVEPDIWNTLHRLTAHLEEPLADSTMVPQYHLSRMARQHVTVALSGDGGDELFAGYTRYPIALGRSDSALLGGTAGRFFRRQVFHALPAGLPGRNFLFNASLPMPARYLDSISFLPVLDRDRRLFSAEYREWARGAGSPYAPFERLFHTAQAADALSRMQYLDTHTNLVGDILTKVDRMSMAVSLEVRCPLLDHELAEWATSLDPSWKLRNGQGKYLLRRLAERLGVPAKTLHRPKRGFTLPLVRWMRKELRGKVQELLLDSRTLQRGYFDPSALRALLKEHFSGRRDRSGAIWLITVLELWHRNFLAAQPAARATQPCEVFAERAMAGSREAVVSAPAGAISSGGRE